jgi:hypothetical protein
MKFVFYITCSSAMSSYCRREHSQKCGLHLCTVWNPSAGSSAYQEKHKRHTQMRTLELDKIQSFTKFYGFRDRFCWE